MASRDNTAILKVLNVLDKATRSATVASATVDTQGFEAVGFQLFAGAAGDTLSSNVTIEWDVQDSPDGITWSAVADTLVNVQFSSTNTLGVPVGTANGAGQTGAAFLATASASLPAGFSLRFGYVGANRYVRVNEVHVGTQTNGTPSQVLCVLSCPAYAPTEGALS